MRPVCALLLAISALAANAKAASAAKTSNVTLVLQFDEAYSPQSLDAMKHEVASIVADSNIKVDWRLLAEVQTSDTFESLVVVHLRGACQMQADPYPFDPRPYYAFTHVSDGQVLPFSEVECDKVAGSIRPAISKAMWNSRDAILGRALGRVLAHELYHMLTKTRVHATGGVTRSALSAAQLISNELRMSLEDLENLHQATSATR